LKLPAISLGLWHNFGGVDRLENGRAMVRRAFDLGITHFDLANNYGPPPGSAEEMFGQILKQDFAAYRDELIISTKAGYYMWEGPYGEWGSRKYLISSLDQSLKRMNLDYVDIFYHHRPDPDTPLEETMAALDHVVRQGKALYVGVSNYSAEQTARAAAILKELGTPFLIHQPSYSMFNRWIENGLQDVLEQEGIGSIVFSPLAGGVLTNRYLNGVPADSRAGGPSVFLKADQITDSKLNKVRELNEIAQGRGQSLAQMSLAWVLRGGRVTSALIGASRVEQIDDNVAALNRLDFSDDELSRIEAILAAE
jgi:L-glyceraldehyde 3-phosphate reductase